MSRTKDGFREFNRTATGWIVRVCHRVPGLLPVRRPQDLPARPRLPHAGARVRGRGGLPAHQPQRALRPPLHLGGGGGAHRGAGNRGHLGVAARVPVGGAGDDLRGGGARLRHAVDFDPAQGELHRDAGREDRGGSRPGALHAGDLLPAAAGERGLRGGHLQPVHRQPWGGAAGLGKPRGRDHGGFPDLPLGRRAAAAVAGRAGGALFPHLGGPVGAARTARLLRLRPDRCADRGRRG